MYFWVSRTQASLKIFSITRAILMADYIWAGRFEWSPSEMGGWLERIENEGKFRVKNSFVLVMFNRVFNYQMDRGKIHKCSLFLYLENEYIYAHWKTTPARSSCQATWFPYSHSTLAFLPWQRWHPPWASWADATLTGTSCLLLAGAPFWSRGFFCAGPLSHLAAVSLFLGYCLVLLA